MVPGNMPSGTAQPTVVNIPSGSSSPISSNSSTSTTPIITANQHKTPNQHKRWAEREVLFLENELQGWETATKTGQDRASTLAIVLVLLVSIQYAGVLTPPGGYSIMATGVVSTPVRSSEHTAVVASLYFNGVGFGLSIAALLSIASYTMRSTLRGQVTKAIHTFTGWVKSVEVSDFQQPAEQDSVAATYQTAIKNNIVRTLRGDIIGWRYKSKDSSGYVSEVETKIGNTLRFDEHHVLYEEVLKFYRVCLVNERETNEKLLTGATVLFIFSLCCTCGAFLSCMVAATAAEVPVAVVTGGVLLLVGLLTALPIINKEKDFNKIAKPKGPVPPIDLTYEVLKAP